MVKPCCIRQFPKITIVSLRESLFVAMTFSLVYFLVPERTESDVIRYANGVDARYVSFQRLYQVYKGATKTSKAFT